jgi:hypothetical protein
LMAYAAAAAKLLSEVPADSGVATAKVLTIKHNGLSVQASVDPQLGSGQVVVRHASDVTVNIV